MARSWIRKNSAEPANRLNSCESSYVLSETTEFTPNASETATKEENRAHSTPSDQREYIDPRAVDQWIVELPLGVVHENELGGVARNS